MQYVDPIEVRLQTEVNAIDHYIKQEEGLKGQLEDVLHKLNEARSRAGELALLRDIRDGKVTVVNSATGEPVKIAIL